MTNQKNVLGLLPTALKGLTNDDDKTRAYAEAKFQWSNPFEHGTSEYYDYESLLFDDAKLIGRLVDFLTIRIQRDIYDGGFIVDYYDEKEISLADIEKILGHLSDNDKNNTMASMIINGINFDIDDVQALYDNGAINNDNVIWLKHAGVDYVKNVVSKVKTTGADNHD